MLETVEQKLEDLLSLETYPLLSVEEYKAAERLRDAYNRLDKDEEVFRLLRETLLERYEEISHRIDDHLRKEQHSSVCLAAKELTSDIRQVVSDSVVQTAVRLQDVSSEGKTTEVYKTWIALHDRLTPVMRILRRLR